MKISKLLQSIIKIEGKKSLTVKKIIRLKNSKESSYLIDATRAS